MEEFVDQSVVQYEEGYCLGTLTGIVEWLTNMDPLSDLDSPLPPSLLDKLVKSRMGDSEEKETSSASSSASTSPRPQGTSNKPPPPQVAKGPTSTSEAVLRNMRSNQRSLRRMDQDSWRETHVRKLVYTLATTRSRFVAKAHQMTLKRAKIRRKKKYHAPHRKLKKKEFGAIDTLYMENSK